MKPLKVLMPRMISCIMAEAVLAIIIGYPNQSSLRMPIILLAFWWTAFRKAAKPRVSLFSLLPIAWGFGTFLFVCLSMLWAGNKKGIEEIWNNVMLCAMVNWILFDYVVTYRLDAQSIAKHFYPIIVLLLVNSLVNGIFNSNRLSLFINANVLGELYVGMMSYFLYLWCAQKKKTGFNALVIVALLLFVLVTGSRKALIAVVIYLVEYSLLVQRKKLNIKSLVRIAAIAGMMALFFFLLMRVDFFYQTIGVRVEKLIGLLSYDTDLNTIGDNSIISRINMTQAAFEIFLEHPLLGIGANNFKYFSRYNTYSHNGYMEILNGLGICGFAIYYIPIFIFLKCAWKNWKADIQEAIVPLCTFEVFLISEVGHVTYFSYYIYCFLGIAMGMTYNMNLLRNRAGVRKTGKASAVRRRRVSL